MNEWPVIGSLRISHQISEIAALQTLQTKYIAKGYFDVQKINFGERSTLFRRGFIING